MKKRLSSLLLLVAVCVAPGLSAQERAAEPANVEDARVRFQRGAELYKEGSFDAALAEFKRAYELAPNYRLLFNLGQVEVERHDYAAALRYFRDYLAAGGAEIAADRRTQVEREIESLTARVAELDVTSNVAGSELSVDGVVVGTLPLAKPVIVSAGLRRISLSKPGHAPVERTITVGGGERPRLFLEFKDTQPHPVHATPAASPPSAPAPSASLGAAEWTGIISTGAFTGAAVVFGVLAHDADGDLDASLSEFPGDAGRIDDDRSKLKLYAGLTDGFAAAALVSAVVTTLLLVSDDSEEPSERNAARTELVPLRNGMALRRNF